ncbi:hypothetical protein ACIQOV_21300 [Kitasatospora sp. NPDC091257]|uniref:hypothetical protein n=1 Tax=Kitasatospora sp. NPDC091257 TaxID=3364084 RepID=UPI00380C48DD
MHRPDGAYPEQGSVVAQTTPGGVGHADILGAGNAVFGNSCVNQGGTQATGGTVANSGVEDAAVRELAALSGRAVPLLREWVNECPRLGVARPGKGVGTRERPRSGRARRPCVGRLRGTLRFDMLDDVRARRCEQPEDGMKVLRPKAAIGTDSSPGEDPRHPPVVAPESAS